MYKSFRTDKNYLTSYHQKSALVWLAATASLVLTFRTFTFSELAFLPALILLSSVDVKRVSLGAIAAVGAAFYVHTYSSIGIMALALAVTPAWVVFATAVLHNAAHGNFKPRWLCRAIGELFGLIQLVGFPDWVVIHIIHHSNPDDPEKDPHPPLGLSFAQFLNGMRMSILKVLLKEYFSLHGQTDETKKSILRLALASKVEQIAKIAFLYVLLGPNLFAFFFAPSVALKMVHYAWFNYVTHVQGQDAGAQVVNRNEGWYRVTNLLTFGLYFHRNHHQNPKLFNPSTLVEASPEKQQSAA